MLNNINNNENLTDIYNNMIFSKKEISFFDCETLFSEITSKHEDNLLYYIIIAISSEKTKNYINRNYLLYKDYIISHSSTGKDSIFYNMFESIRVETLDSVFSFLGFIDLNYPSIRNDESMYQKFLIYYKSLEHISLNELRIFFDNIQKVIQSKLLKYYALKFVQNEINQDDYIYKIKCFENNSQMSKFFDPRYNEVFDFGQGTENFNEKKKNEIIKLPKEMIWLTNSLDNRGFSRGDLIGVLGRAGRGKTLFINNLTAGLIRESTGNKDLKIHITYVGDMSYNKVYSRMVSTGCHEHNVGIMQSNNYEHYVRTAKQNNPHLYDDKYVYVHKLSPMEFSIHDYESYLKNTDYKDTKKKIIDYFDVFVVDYEGNFAKTSDGSGLGSHHEGGEKYATLKRIAEYKTDDKAKVVIVTIQPKTFASGSKTEGIKELSMDDISESAQKQRFLDLLIAVNVNEENTIPNHIGNFTILKNRDGNFFKQYYLKDFSGNFVYIPKEVYDALNQENKTNGKIAYTTIESLYNKDRQSYPITGNFEYKAITNISTSHKIIYVEKPFFDSPGNIDHKIKQVKEIKYDISYVNSNSINSQSHNNEKNVIEESVLTNFEDNNNMLDNFKSGETLVITDSSQIGPSVYVNKNLFLDREKKCIIDISLGDNYDNSVQVDYIDSQLSEFNLEEIHNMSYLDYTETKDDDTLLDMLRFESIEPSWFKYVPEFYISPQGKTYKPREENSGFTIPMLKLLANFGIMYLKKKYRCS